MSSSNAMNCVSGENNVYGALIALNYTELHKFRL